MILKQKGSGGVGSSTRVPIGSSRRDQRPPLVGSSSRPGHPVGIAMQKAIAPQAGGPVGSSVGGEPVGSSSRPGYRNLLDLFDGGGPSASGPRFEGGGVFSGFANALFTPMQPAGADAAPVGQSTREGPPPPVGQSTQSSPALWHLLTEKFGGAQPAPAPMPSVGGNTFQASAPSPVPAMRPQERPSYGAPMYDRGPPVMSQAPMLPASPETPFAMAQPGLCRTEERA